MTPGPGRLGPFSSRLLPLVLLCVLLLGCGDAAGNPPSDGGGEDVSLDQGVELTVFAAASLSSAFRSLAEAYEEGEGDTRVLLNLAGSQTLAAQILEGAPADLFASANPAQMRRVAEAGMLADPPVTIATNALAIAVEPGNPRKISGLRDLAAPDLSVVLGAPGVPVGDYARRAVEAAGVDVRPASLETDVKQVLAKVSLGEADAGIVYETDVQAAGDAVEGIPIRPTVNQLARYRMAVLKRSTRPVASRGFLDFVRSAEGREILGRHGFEIPDSPRSFLGASEGRTGGPGEAPGFDPGSS